jgi:hypothetical protein
MQHRTSSLTQTDKHVAIGNRTILILRVLASQKLQETPYLVFSQGAEKDKQNRRSHYATCGGASS